MEDHVDVAVGPANEDDFDPRIAHITEGGSVTFEWASGNHDVTSFHLELDWPNRTPPGSTPFAQDISSPGDTLTVEFDDEGVWDVLCARHHDVGMVMKIIIGTPDLDEEPGMAAPQDILADALQSRIAELNDQARAIFEEGTD